MSGAASEPGLKRLSGVENLIYIINLTQATVICINTDLAVLMIFLTADAVPCPQRSMQYGRHH